MRQASVPLDPTKTGREALELEANLHKRIVGQPEAIREIVSIYHMDLAGMTAPGGPIGNGQPDDFKFAVSNGPKLVPNSLS